MSFCIYWPAYSRVSFSFLFWFVLISATFLLYLYFFFSVLYLLSNVVYCALRSLMVCRFWTSLAFNSSMTSAYEPWKVTSYEDFSLFSLAAYRSLYAVESCDSNCFVEFFKTSISFVSSCSFVLDYWSYSFSFWIVWLPVPTSNWKPSSYCFWRTMVLFCSLTSLVDLLRESYTVLISEDNFS